MALAITGRRARIASSSTSPNDSARSVDGRQNTSAFSYAACSVAAPRSSMSMRPANCTRPAMPRSIARRCNAARHSPSPTIDRLAFPTSAMARSKTSMPLK